MYASTKKKKKTVTIFYTIIHLYKKKGLYEKIYISLIVRFI